MFLGIDGGGSHTRALLVDSEGKQLHYQEAGPTNLNVVSETDAKVALGELIEGCKGASKGLPNAICMGLAGAANSKIQSKLREILQPYDFGRSLIISDAEIALDGAFSGGEGILLIAGTGSACFGKSSSGKLYRTGGWGWLADDAGSAGWIGQRAIELAIRQHDGRLEGASIKDPVFTALEIENDDDISTRLYYPSLDRARIAGLAPQLLALAEQGDQIAVTVRDAAVAQLESLVRSTAHKLNTETSAVALAGGLFEHSKSFREALTSRLTQFKVQAPDLRPVEGAARIAMQLAQ